jgi:hypothetical protein
MALLNLPSLLTPTLRKDAEKEDIISWGQALSSVIKDLQQNLESTIEAFINSPEQIGTDVIIADAIVAGSINAGHISVTGAVITQTIQVQDAIITNAKVVDIETQKVFVTGDSAVTLTTAGSTLILPGLLQISGGGDSQKSLHVRGTATGVRGTAARSLLINGVEQYTASAITSPGIVVCRLDTSGTVIPGSMKAYDTLTATADQDGLAAALAFDGSAGETFVLSSRGAIGTGLTSPTSNAGILLRRIGIDANSLEGAFATGGNNGVPSRIPFVGLGARDIGNGAGVTVFNNGATGGGPAEYADWLFGNIPAKGSSPQTSDITVIEGGKIRTSTVTADKISVSQLSAITANMGVLNAGEIRGGLIVGPIIGSSTDAATLGGIYMTTAGLFLYSSAGVNTGYLAPSGAGFFGNVSDLSWTGTGGVTVGGAGIADGSISASALNVATLSAITADMGKLTAGEIVGGSIYAGATSSTRMELTSSGLKGYNSANQRVNIANDGSGWFGSSTAFTWTTGGAVTVDGGRLLSSSVTTPKRQNVNSDSFSFSMPASNAGNTAGVGAFVQNNFTNNAGVDVLVIPMSGDSQTLANVFNVTSTTLYTTANSYFYGVPFSTTVALFYW